MDDVKAFKVDCVSHPCTWTMEFFLIESCELLIAWTTARNLPLRLVLAGIIVLTLRLCCRLIEVGNSVWPVIWIASLQQKHEKLCLWVRVSVMTNDTATPKQWNVFSSNVFVTSNTLVSFFLITIANRVKWFLHSKNAVSPRQVLKSGMKKTIITTWNVLSDIQVTDECLFRYDLLLLVRQSSHVCTCLTTSAYRPVQ